MTITINDGSGLIGYIDGDGNTSVTYKLSSASQTFSYPAIKLMVSSSYLLSRSYVKLNDLALYRESTLVEQTSYTTWASTGWGTKGNWLSATWKKNFTVNASAIFTQNNRNQRTVPYYLYVTAGNTSIEGVDADGGYSAYAPSTVRMRTINIELDAPPTVEVGTPTYSNPQYAGLGEYSVPITKAQAKYSGYVQTITLTVGSDSVTQNYSATTVTNQTLSLTPSVAGTYTPTITVTDTRGQSTTVNLEQITVNAYTAPSISFDLQRTNGSGIPNAEGEHGLVTASISYTDAIAELTQPTVAVRDEDGNLVVSSATWYETWDATNGVSDAVNWTDYNPQSPATLYAVVSATGSSFSPNESYTVSITPTDNQGGVAQTITQTLSTGFFTIDFKAGGKEIAFGAPANDDLTDVKGKDYSGEGLFKCAMNALFGSDTVMKDLYLEIDTSAPAGTTDGDLYAAITALGWENDVIE